MAAARAADAIDTHVTYEILLSAAAGARGRARRAQWWREEARVSSHFRRARDRGRAGGEADVGRGAGRGAGYG